MHLTCHVVTQERSLRYGNEDLCLVYFTAETVSLNFGQNYLFDQAVQNIKIFFHLPQEVDTRQGHFL